MRIAKFQNWLYEQNRHWRYTDGTLCALWTVEFPEAHADYVKAETLSIELTATDSVDDAYTTTFKLDGDDVTIGVRKTG